MKIRLRFFSTLRTHFREEEKVLEISGPKSAKDIFIGLFDSVENAMKFLGHTRFAVNCEYVSSETLVQGGDELAFIPPVSGG